MYRQVKNRIGEIQKVSGQTGALGIAIIRDQVAQEVLKLASELILGSDF